MPRLAYSRDAGVGECSRIVGHADGAGGAGNPAGPAVQLRVVVAIHALPIAAVALAGQIAAAAAWGILLGFELVDQLQE